MRKTSVSAIVIGSLILNTSTVSAIEWSESITAGSTQVKATHINELRDEIEDLRSDVDGGAGADNLGNHTATQNINVNDRVLQNVHSVQGRDYDDNTGGTDNKYRLLYRDGAHMFYDGGVSIGGYGNGTWSDLASGRLIVKDRIGIGKTNPGQALDVVGNITASGNVFANGTKFEGDGKEIIRFSDGWLRLNPASEFSSGTFTPSHLMVSGNVGIGTTSPAQKLDVHGNIRMATGYNLLFGTGNQRFVGDADSAMTYRSANSTTTQMMFRDNENTVYGRIYGSGNGSDFGLLDGDGNWGLQMKKDVHTGFLVNNSEKMRILANGNVGIGTTTPGAKLDVQGNIKLNDRIDFDTAVDAAVVATRVGTTDTLTISANDNVDLKTAGNVALRVQGSGNVGIGTTSPETALHVIKNGSGQPTAIFEQTGASPNVALVDATNGMRFEYNSGADQLRIQNATVTGAYDATTVASFGRNGNVGIGTTSPSSRLHVNGTITATSFVGNGSGLTGVTGDNLGNHSASQALYLNNNALVSAGGSNYDFIRHNDGTNTWNFGSDRANINNTTSGGGSIAVGNIELSSRNVRFGNGDQRIYGDNGAAIYADSNHSSNTQMVFRDKEDTVYGRIYGDSNGGSFGLLDGDGNWGIRMEKDQNTVFKINDSEKLRIQTNGNVGIGTVSPDSKLEVAGDMKVTSAAPTLKLEDTNNDDFLIHRNSDVLYFMNDNNDNGTWDDGEDDRIVMKGFTNGVSLGVGTSNPEQKLHVSGGHMLLDNSYGLYGENTSGAASRMLHVGGDDYLYVNANNNTTGIRMQTNGANRLSILSNGNVGIGTTSPAAKLHTLVNGEGLRVGRNTTQYTQLINNSGGATIQTISPTNNAKGLTINSTNPGNAAATSGSNFIRLLVKGSEQMRVTDNGRIGIGTASPSSRLHVKDSGWTTLTVEATTNDTDPTIELKNDADGAASWTMRLDESNADKFQWRWNNTARMTLGTNGNLGIGTSAPSQKLDVVGTVKATNFSGNGSGLTGLTGSSIANDTLTASDLAANSVNASEISAGAVGASEIANGSIVATTELSATGTKNSSTFLRGDNRWATVAGDNLGNHSASAELDMNNRAIREVNSLQLGTEGSFIGNNLYYSGGWKYRANGTANYIRHGSTGSIQFATAPSGSAGAAASMSDRMIIRGDNGHVGIGITSPSQKLEVRGNAKINSNGNYTFLNLGKQGYDQIYADNTSGGNYGGGIWFRVANSAGSGYTDSLRLAENGYVGIGKNPGQKLDVEGTVRATKFSGNGSTLTSLNASNITSGTIPNARIGADSIGSGKLAAGSVGASEISNGSIVATTELSATGTKNSSTFLRGDNKWATVAGDNLGNHVATSNLNVNDRDVLNVREFELKDLDDNTGGTDNKYRLLARDGAFMFHNGGVAIGQYANGTWSDLGDGDLVVKNQVGIGTTNTTGNLASGASLAIGDSDTGFKQMGDGQLGIFANNGERIRVASGNVGIGDTTPESKLTVAGDVRMTSGRSLYYGTGAQRLYGDSSRYFYADGNHDTEVGMIFRDKQDKTYGRVYGSGNGNNFGLLDGDSQWAVNVVKDSHVALADNNEQTFVAGQGGVSGNYGTVQTYGGGKGAWEGYSINGRYVLMSNDNSTVGMYNDVDNRWITQYSRDSNYYRIFNPNNTAVAMHIAAGGNVGIGTNSPTMKLDVAGHIRTTNSVRANNYCDSNGANCTSPANLKPTSCTNINWSNGFELGGSDKPDGNRYHVIADSVSMRCEQLGYDFGFVRKQFASRNATGSDAGWCGYSNARTAYWDERTNKWESTSKMGSSCMNGSVAQAKCCNIN